MSSQLRGQAEEVEVLLVDDDVADEAGVGVHAGTDHEPAGLRLLGVDVEDHVGLGARKHLERAGRLRTAAPCRAAATMPG